MREASRSFIQTTLTRSHRVTKKNRYLTTDDKPDDSMKSILCVILIATGALAHRGKLEKLEIAPCPKLCYTPWFDRDDPSGYGDYETLTHLRQENPGKICDHPYSIQARTLAGADASTTGQVFSNYDTVIGFACVNAQQVKSACLDYKVRFACPCP